jgi:elongation factor Ts
MVKQLRDKTGAGMMDCKTALTETKGDMEGAVDWLRTKGLAKAAKKAGRVAAEGLIGVAAEGNKAVIVEVNSETDFVARNAQFQALVAGTAKAALGTDGNVESVGAAPFPGSSKSVDAEIKDAVATIGENMTLRRAAKLEVGKGVVATYVHASVAPGLGKIGVLVGIESGGDAAALGQFGRQVAMHIAASNPIAVEQGQIEPSLIERERGVYREQAKETGKPDNVIEKMVEGRLRKYFEEVVLLSQAFVVDPDKTVAVALKDFEKTAGAPVKITGFVVFRLGEGVERAESDFAAEVAAAAGKK